MSDFYQIESVENVGGLTSVTVRVNSEHDICRAHFPSKPITPGAMLISIAIDLVTSEKGVTSDVDELKNVKFLSPHNPVAQPRLTFVIDASKSPVDVSVMADETAVAKMTLVI